MRFSRQVIHALAERMYLDVSAREEEEDRFGLLKRAYAIRVENTLDWYGVFMSFPSPERAAEAFYELSADGFLLCDR